MFWSVKRDLVMPAVHPLTRLLLEQMIITHPEMKVPAGPRPYGSCGNILILSDDRYKKAESLGSSTRTARAGPERTLEVGRLISIRAILP
jgi:hypothetical protein